MIFVLLTIVLSSAVAQQEQLTLEYASLVFRHGARSPVGYQSQKAYPNDPWPPESWPQGYGQLNFNGSRMHFQLGRLVKHRYTVENNLLSLNYTRNELYVRSTDVDRTLMSVLSQLSAIYPPEEDQRLNGTIDWQPIPVHTVAIEREDLISPHAMTCQRYDALLDANKKSAHYKNLTEEYKDFFTFLESVTGMADVNLKTVWRISDTVIVERQWGRNPGDWVNDTVADKLQKLGDEDMYLMYGDSNSEEKRRLTSGNLVGQIVARMVNKSKPDNNSLIPGTKLVLYSAHDTTVAAFLSALEIFDKKQPPYAATVFVELYSDTSTPKKYFVKTWYLNKNTVDGFDLSDTSKLLLPMSVRGCDILCPLDKFIELTASVVPNDWEKECRNKKSNSSEDHEEIVIISVVGGILALLIMMLIIVFCSYLHRRHHRYQQMKEIQ
ncbi:prostatic acid phosphatase-like [Dysidea avara]|uniref:prostatic acid phosphatase-like n=1 Tax=Dysidea avara TaxID=196820 RepID=UPI00332DCA38